MISNEDYIKDGTKMVIYTYSTEHLMKKDKIRFYYALKGRDGKSGIVKALKIIHLGRTVLMAPQYSDEEVLQFFKVWNLPFSRRKVMADQEVSRGGYP